MLLGFPQQTLVSRPILLALVRTREFRSLLVMTTEDVLQGLFQSLQVFALGHYNEHKAQQPPNDSIPVSATVIRISPTNYYQYY